MPKSMTKRVFLEILTCPGTKGARFWVGTPQGGPAFGLGPPRGARFWVTQMSHRTEIEGGPAFGEGPLLGTLLYIEIYMTTL